MTSPHSSSSSSPLRLQHEPTPTAAEAAPSPMRRLAPRFRAPTVVAPSRRDFCATTQLLRDLLVSTTAVLFACTTSVRTTVESPRVALATRSPRATASMSDVLAARAADATARHGRKPVGLMPSVGCLALALPLTGTLSLFVLSLERLEEEERRETQDTVVPAYERLPHERRLPRARTRAPHKQQYAGWSFIHGRAHTTPRSPLLHARTLRTP
uniref:Uncharacterized protein n=2 Tax=Aegilops tauschii subsp. strangulata TaxID=200361 RepID=A0A453LU85_AEGTS